MSVEGCVEEIGDNPNMNDTCEIVEPLMGKVFDKVDDLKDFYKKYASLKGFGWKVRTSKKGVDGECRYVALACTREGASVSKIPTTLKTLPTQKALCEVKVTASMGPDGRWYVKTIIRDHSHELSPSKSQMFQKNTHKSMHVRRTIDINDEEGVHINKTFQTIIHEAGGHEQLQFVERDVRNYINKERRSFGKDGDGKAMVDYFGRMKDQNENFWYDIDFDGKFHIRNIVWADARSHAAYEYFGDIVSFDTTYLTNKYELPFAAFVGVNHHGEKRASWLWIGFS